MLKSWIKIFLNHSVKNKSFTFLTILGLAVGITSIIFSTLYWRNETSYDQWNSEKNDIYEVLSILPSGEVWGIAQSGLAKNIQAKTDKLQDYCYYLPYYNDENLIVDGKDNFSDKIIVTQSNFFDFFPFEFTQGSSESFKNNLNGIAIEENLAKKIFGSENPINKNVIINEENLVVFGVYKLNEASSLKPKVVLSTINQNLKDNESQWGNYNFSLMLKIPNENDVDQIEKIGEEVLTVNKLIPGAKEEGISLEQLIKESGKYSIELQSLNDVRLSKKTTGFLEGKGNRLLLQINLGLSFLILALSIINYINLSTAQAMRRAKEVGVRKVFGASKKNIVYQFVFETAIITFFAVLCALCITELCLPYYNNLIDKSLVLNILDFGFYLFLIFLIVILFAGFFPAIYIANFEELKVLKGNFSRSKNGIWIRNGMLIFQFSIATFFIVSGFIVKNQVNYLANKDLGFNSEQILSISYNRSDVNRFKSYEAFKQDILKIEGVLDVNVSTANFGSGASSSSGFSLPNSKLSTQAQNIGFDFGYLKMFNMQILEGRDLDSNIASDTIENVILNQRAVQDLGGNVPLGTEFEWNERKMKVVGIVKNFNLRSPQEEVYPMLLMHMKTVNWMYYNINNVLVKIEPDKASETIASLEKLWTTKVYPNAPFEFDFVDKKFARSYESYTKQQAMFRILNMVVISIALFGLFALASFTIERKYKEIAIRKVLGAETNSLLILLTKQYILMVLVGFLIAIIPSYILMQKWLNNFNYRIEIDVFVYVFALLILLILTLIVVLLKAYVATRINLLAYLKYE